MASLTQELRSRLVHIVETDPELRPASKPQFGHFQCNVAMKLGKQQGRLPREVAAEIVAQAQWDDIVARTEIAGPGFINMWLRPEAIAAAAAGVVADAHTGIVQADEAEVVVIDYSAPNAAKKMHVGHLRSTVIGDCFHRVLEAQGHRVVPANHIGDWGRQFGMMIELAMEENADLDSLDIGGAEDLYRRANARLKTDEAFAERARQRVVALQTGDETTTRAWHAIIDLSKESFNSVYRRMGVLLGDDDYAGESFYNALLGPVCEDLAARGIAVEDAGALVVFVDGFDAPAIVRNSHGGYGYDVTDIAAIRYRVDELGAHRIIYVVGSEQIHHFKLVFGVCRKAGYLPDSVRAEHTPYGMVLGADGKKFSTREGAVHLEDILDEAEERVPREIAMAAIKYADLSNQIIRDYSFDLDRMTATTGNTGPYLQYAHARCAGVLRKAEAEGLQPGVIAVLETDHEQALALAIDGFGDVVAEVAQELAPHKLCTYLYELASAYSAFYENCPILGAEEQTRSSRLGLVQATQHVLDIGLGLLGIHAPEVM